MNIQNNTGLIADPRTDAQKALDYQAEETYSAIVLNWKRDISKAPTYTPRPQNGSGTCVAQSSAKALETHTGVSESAHPVYSRRPNSPGIGMWLQAAGDIVRNKGTTTEVLDNSINKSEEYMDSISVEDTPVKGHLYTFPKMDIDSIAQAVELQKHCLITIGVNPDEYYAFYKPVVIPYSGTLSYHCICATYYFTDENGVKCLLVDDSANEAIPRRIITEDFLKARITGAMYFVPPVQTQPAGKPQFTFQTPLLYGQSNYSIKALQDILKYENLFPTNIDSTGYFGAITAKGVLAFQIKHNVAGLNELNQLGGKRVGIKTISALNLLYS